MKDWARGWLAKMQGARRRASPAPSLPPSFPPQPGRGAPAIRSSVTSVRVRRVAEHLRDCRIFASVGSFQQTTLQLSLGLNRRLSLKALWRNLDGGPPGGAHGFVNCFRAYAW